MRKKDLRNGMVCVSKDGVARIFMTDVKIKERGRSSIFVSDRNGILGGFGYLSLSSFNDDLTYQGESQWDIEAIYECDYFGDLIENLASNGEFSFNDSSKYTLISKRVKPVEMTTREIEIILGYSIIIVEEEV